MSEHHQTDYFMSRRTFLKGVAVTGGSTAALVASSGKVLHALEQISGLPDPRSDNKEKIVTTCCRPNCHGGCRLNVHVRGGKIVKTSPASFPDKRYDRICLRGYSHPQYVYSPNRLKYPMKRVGNRGEGKWKRISWDEARDTIVSELNKIKEKHGSQALAFAGVSGSLSTLDSGSWGIYQRLFNSLKGTIVDGTLDWALIYGMMRVTGNIPMNDATDYVNAKTLIVIGANITEAQIHHWHFVADAMEGGTRLIVIDPRFTATAAKADQWIPIRPGSDAALIMGMIQVILEAGLQDKRYLHDHTVGPFLVREDTGKFLRLSHLSSEADQKGLYDSAMATKPTTGTTSPVDPAMVWDTTANHAVPLTAGVQAALEGNYTVAGIKVTTAFSLLKAAVADFTPKQVSALTDIPAETISALATTYATQTPASIYTMMGIDHYDNAHMTGHAMATLGAVTGNLGKHGASLWPAYYLNEHLDWIGYLYPDGLMGTLIPTADLRDATVKGKLGEKPFPVKALVVSMSNLFENAADQNMWLKEVVPGLEFIVTCELQMSTTARYSDIILPVTHWFETTDIQQAQSHPYIMHGPAVIDPLFEAKSNFEIVKMLAPGLGVGKYFDYTTDQMLDIAISKKFTAATGFTLDEIKKQGVVNPHPGEPFINIGKDGVFPTPSGRVEFYCEAPKPRIPWSGDVNFNPRIEHLPRFWPPLETWPEHSRSKQYPFSLHQEHTRWRVHTQWGDVPWLRELDPEPTVNINPKAADDRGILSGDYVEVYNDRGLCVVKAVLNEAVPYHFLTLPKGWQKHQFKSGAYQELTHQKLNPASVNQSFFDVSVNVRKWEGV